MTVKIDKYESREYKGNYYIRDRLTNRDIISFGSLNHDLNKALCELVLDELNTGKYEGKE